MKLASTSGIH